MNESQKAIIRKIQALLETTVERGASEAEATSAAALAQRLLLKHGMAMSELKDVTDEGESTEAITDDSIWMTKVHRAQWVWQKNLVCVIAACTCCTSNVYGRGAGYQLFGTATNVQVAKRLIEWITTQMVNVATDAKATAVRNRGKVIDGKYWEHYLGQNFLRSYLLGMTERVTDALKADFRETVEQIDAGQYVLERIDKAKAASHAAANGVAFSGRVTSGVNRTAYVRGMNDASKIKLRPEDSLVADLGGPKALTGAR